MDTNNRNTPTWITECADAIGEYFDASQHDRDVIALIIRNRYSLAPKESKTPRFLAEAFNEGDGTYRP